MWHDAEPRVRLLGRPAVRDDDGRWREFPPGQRGAALGYFAFAQRWVARDELVALFWPDRPESTARGNLRPLLSRVAREPLASGLERERTRLRWPVESDHAAVMAAQRDRRWDDAWRLVTGGCAATGTRDERVDGLLVRDDGVEHRGHRGRIVPRHELLKRPAVQLTPRVAEVARRSASSNTSSGMDAAVFIPKE